MEVVLGRIIDVSKLMDNSRVCALQVRVSLLCGLTFLLDGFDTTIVGSIAPSLAKDLHATHAALGQMFSAAAFGLLVGYLVISPFAGRLGQRRIMITSVFAFGAFTFASGFATSIGQLTVLRFLTGIGLGSALPGAVALPGEYSPLRWRATFIMLMGLGMTFGLLLPGFVTALTISSWGWQGLLKFGGIIAMLFSVILFAFLLESLEYLVSVKRDKEATLHVVHAIAPRLRLDEDVTFAVETHGVRTSSVIAIFQERRTLGTLALWIGMIVNALVSFFMQNWLPTIFVEAGYGHDKALVMNSIGMSAGVIAALVSGPLMDRWGPYRVIYNIFALGVVFVALIGVLERAGAIALCAMAFGAYFCLAGTQKSFGVLGVAFYPTALRATGLGWGYGIGRLGGIVGALGAGLLLGSHWHSASLFYFAAVFMAIGAGAIYAMYRRYGDHHGHAAMPAVADVDAETSGIM